VAEWAAFVLFADGARDYVQHLDPVLPSDVQFGVTEGLSEVMEKAFWSAHNTALRHGVLLADQQQLRDRAHEPQEEGDMTNIILYTVLEPGDQCANDRNIFCVMTFPIFEQVGLIWYPPSYPATRAELDRLLSNYVIFYDGQVRTAGLAEVYFIMQQNGARFPSNEHHCLDPAVNVQSPCHR
jgi:hypothetical protein